MWKTIDGAPSWKPLWDDFPEASPAVGAVAVAPSDPKIVYAGTGEINIRGNVATGNGLYKSTDAGKTWRFSGLRDSQVIGRIIVRSLRRQHRSRGGARTYFRRQSGARRVPLNDGGANWKKALYVDAKTGASDVAFDPNNPKILYAGLWQAYRKPWIMESGGPGKRPLQVLRRRRALAAFERRGLPDGILGRVNVAPTSDSKVIYAMIEAQEGRPLPLE